MTRLQPAICAMPSQLLLSTGKLKHICEMAWKSHFDARKETPIAMSYGFSRLTCHSSSETAYRLPQRESRSLEFRVAADMIWALEMGILPRGSQKSPVHVSAPHTSHESRICPLNSGELLMILTKLRRGKCRDFQFRTSILVSARHKLASARTTDPRPQLIRTEKVALHISCLLCK